ncbi:hypothetical protein [Sphingomicrobium lutaoense]|uniref:Uncharacterized protein n=1 Tax=Sphingomicrobium lutaoense TaxID=515949 RepID=A0A839Z5S0_9SPHN|nr:hypothetical protein [Sphingomicrobium lutaoense]MBB3764034.1 hypothetical protein [Sphingomicrobium lutaoense]
MKKLMLAALGAATMTFGVPAAAQDETPLRGGEYWEVATIDVADGQGLRYAEWLATDWRAFNDYAKSQGWISDYKILSNVHGRPDEGDIFLITKFSSMPDAAEGERRSKAFRAQMKRSAKQLAAESGNRAEYRKVMGSVLLQELHFRD